MSFPRYPSYKDSGVEWLREVPEHWQIRRLKQNLALLTEKAERRDLAVALENIQSWTGKFIETETELQGEGVAFESGDILFGKLRPYLAKAWLADRPGEAVGDFHVLRPVSDVDGRFSLYQILTGEFISIIDGSTFGAKMPRVSWDFLAAMLLTTPPRREQTAIATFLDRETAKIDALVAEYRTLIELLKEKRQAVISHAVTKGLDPRVPMKDSGVEWLGEVPGHWHVTRLKRVSPHVTVGIVVEPSKYYVESDGVPALRSLNVRPGWIDAENAVLISSEANDALSKSRLYSGDLVAVRSGQPGTTAVVPSEMDGFNCIDLIIVRRPPAMSGPYLCWFMNSDPAQHQFSEGSGGAIQQHFNIGTAMNLVVPEPPRAEQDAIETVLRNESERLDALVSEAEQGISLLQERRTALISAAVTGKIDVRGLVAEADLLDALAETRADLAEGRFAVESADAHMDRVEAGLDGGT